MKPELESLLARIVTWPEEAQGQLMHAINEIEARRSNAQDGSGCGAGDGDAQPRTGFVADAETEAFMKRHCSNYL